MVELVYGTGLENRRSLNFREFKSHPFRHYSPIAQLVEHLTVNQSVVGSSPTRGAKGDKVVIQVKEGIMPIKLKTVSDMPKVGDYLYIPDKVMVTEVCSSALGVIVNVERKK